MADEANDEAEARARALALLQATHQFPCAYSVTVIAYNREPVTVAIKGAACAPVDGPPPSGTDTTLDLEEYQSRESREGKYLSHRFAVRVAHAAEVLDARHDAEDLPAAEPFALDRLAHHHAVERHDEGAHGQAINRRRRDQAHLAHAGER